MKIVYKPAGVLGTQVANEYKIRLKKNKVCICGKLDPMAEGQLLLLFDEDCKKMNDYLNSNKVYQFKILWGFKTTSDDTLGSIINTTKITYNNLDYNYINTQLQNFIGTYNQEFHKYSAKPVHNSIGEKHSLWKWTYLNRLDEIIIPYKKVNVEYIRQLNTEKKNFILLKKDILEVLYKVDNTNNTFCKNNAIQEWVDFDYKMLYNTNDVYITTFEAHVSTGYYIRQFINEFGLQTGLLGTSININRIRII
jgi:tRNA pseudouridine(55) synthase